MTSFRKLLCRMGWHEVRIGTDYPRTHTVYVDDVKPGRNETVRLACGYCNVSMSVQFGNRPSSWKPL